MTNAEAPARWPCQSPKDLDCGLIERLAAIACTLDEIGTVLGCSAHSLQRHHAPAIERGRSRARVSLRRRQWKAAQAGDTEMLIWLGKQWLGQRDEPRSENEPHMNAAHDDCSGERRNG